MIIFTNKNHNNFIDYGINIPIFSSKAETTFKKLSSHHKLKKDLNKWFIKFENIKIERIDLLRVHSKEYIDKLFSDKLEDEIIKTYELDKKDKRYLKNESNIPLNHLFIRALKNVSGTYQCCKEALVSGFCFFLGGGLHHAQKEYGNGFCLINDIVISIKRLIYEQKINNVWVIDVDAHKGDGTAALTINDDSIITLSIHMAKGWPLNEQKYNENGNLNPSFIPSNIDIPIKEGEESEYLKKLKEGLNKLGKFNLPDLAVVVSGVDPYKKDKLESAKLLKLSKKQIFKRDKFIYNFLKEKRIPKAYLMAGGYGEKAWKLYTRFIKWVLINRLMK